MSIVAEKIFDKVQHSVMIKSFQKLEAQLVTPCPPDFPEESLKSVHAISTLPGQPPDVQLVHQLSPEGLLRPIQYFQA